ncbi:hypothetical protein CK203_072516 [Vitis vinifera]|uniref:Retrotransposon gag domain-containing protein n=1 Tax=Vitis vinifera TaxID=29760 RepID=A0A438F941_VITVI|nr:hypothetical protein CK203_072516 [Vitis vinifera]
MGEPSPLGNPLGMRGSACVEVMTTLHGSTPSLWRRAEGCVPPEGFHFYTWVHLWTFRAALVTIGFDYSLHSPILCFRVYRSIFLVPSLDSPLWTRVRGRLTRVSDQPDQKVDHRDMDSQTDATPLPVVAPIQASEDAHARMDRLEQRMRQMRVSDGNISWNDFDGAPVVSLLTQFRMPEIESYTGIGCPKIHLRLYSSVMRAHGLDEAHLIMLFPMSLSGAAHRWRELEALRQGPDESVTSFISRWREKIAQIVDRPSEKDQISIILRSLQPRFARHLMGFPHTDFRSLVQALYGIEEGIARGFWPESSPSDSKGKKPLGGQRPGDVSAISSVGSRSPRRYQTFGQASGAYYPQRYVQYRPPRLMAPTYLHQTSKPVFAAQPSVITNPLPAHSTHAVPPPPGAIHHINFVKDDSIHMMSWDDGLPEPIVLDDGYEVDTGSPAPFILRLDDDDLEGRDVQIVTRSGRVAQPPPLVVRPFDGAVSHEEIRVETTTTLEGLIHMMTADRATCIVFSDDNLLPDGLDHVRPLYITVGCSGHRVPSVLLDNGSALNVCPLATAIALVSCLQILVLLLRQSGRMIAPRGRLWVITVRSTRDIFIASEPVLQISHSEDDLLLTGFTFDEIQTLEIEDFCRDFVAMSFDQHSSTVVLDMMRGMTFLPGMGLGRRQHGPSEFIAAINHDTTFGLGFIPTEADYRYMARLRKERVRARLSHTPFDYPIRPYKMSLADYFVRGSEIRPRLEEIDSVVHIDRETELRIYFTSYS